MQYKPNVYIFAAAMVTRYVPAHHLYLTLDILVYIYIYIYINKLRAGCVLHIIHCYYWVGTRYMLKIITAGAYDVGRYSKY